MYTLLFYADFSVPIVARQNTGDHTSEIKTHDISFPRTLHPLPSLKIRSIPGGL